MKIVITETEFTVEGATPNVIEGAPPEMCMAISTLKAILWAADRLTEEISMLGAGEGARLAIETAKGKM